jgi:hypothetical protein
MPGVLRLTKSFLRETTTFLPLTTAFIRRMDRLLHPAREPRRPAIDPSPTTKRRSQYPSWTRRSRLTSASPTAFGLRALFEGAHVPSILRATDGALVRDEVRPPDHVRVNSVQFEIEAPCPGGTERYSRDRQEEVDPRRRATHPHDLVRRRRSQVLDQALGHAEDAQRGTRPRDVFRRRVEPQIEILGRPRPGVHSDGVTPDDQVPNPSVGERREHRDQISGEFHRRA